MKNISDDYSLTNSRQLTPNELEIRSMEQNQFNTLMLAISGLKGEIVALDSKLSAKIDAVDSKLSAKIDTVDSKLSAKIDKLDVQGVLLRQGIADIKTELVTKINVQGADHENRIKKLEGPSA